MRVGLHVRVADGYPAAIAYAKSVGCNAIQIFSSNPRSYRRTAIDVPAMKSFASARIEAGIDPCVIHTPYLINLASDDPKIRHGSLGLLEHDLEAAAHGGIAYVNTHLGSYGKRDREEGFITICRYLEKALADVKPGVHLVIENSAGAGSLAGGTLEELGRFVKALDHPQLGICLDTAHAWAAGYQIDSRDGVERFVDRAEELIGLDRIRMFHFNDTEVELGANRDRHWHIGQGKIGLEGFRALLARPELRDKTAILETPGEEAEDRRNLQTILDLERAVAAA